MDSSSHPAIASVFVSSQRVDLPQVVELLAALRSAGVAVEHSPRNPLDGEDARWRNWYDVGLPAAVARSGAVVIVLEPGWDSATWMGNEGDAAMAWAAAAPGRMVYYWNPFGIDLGRVAVGMRPYLLVELPREVGRAAAVLARAVDRSVAAWQSVRPLE